MKNNFHIPEGVVEFRFSRSGGPGGQNVNKVNTKVTAFLDVPRCGVFNEEQKRQIFEKLGNRINQDGILILGCQRFRTQKANQQGVIEKLNLLIGEALKPRKVRRKTKVPYAAKVKRLEKKKRRGILKRERSGQGWGKD